MPQFLNPKSVVQPSSNYAQGVLVAPGARRLILSGQVGVRPDGTLCEGLEAQTEQVFDNILALLKEAGMDVTNLVKIVTYCTRPQELAAVRRVRAHKLGNHTPASTFLIVPALANPDYLIEIEGEAVQEI
ncbi:MAG: RidA family protein [Hyphomicrobiales bacterium]|nr:RidA family protein [Hyphomicrobiales bacterium]